MSKLSVFIHNHATLVDNVAGFLSLGLSFLPVPNIIKAPLLGAVDQLKATAENMHNSAETVIEQLIADALAGAQVDETSPQIQTQAQQLQQAAAAVQSSAMTVNSNINELVAAPKPTNTLIQPVEVVTPKVAIEPVVEPESIPVTGEVPQVTEEVPPEA